MPTSNSQPADDRLTNQTSRPRVAIIGAGITGLTLAHELAGSGIDVDVFEAGPAIGGELGVVEVNGEPVERFYHHLFLDSPEIQGLMRELGVADRLTWKTAPMAYFTGGRLFPFNTPWDLLNFSPISPPARLRMGLAALRLQMVTDYAKYEDACAADVLPDLSGREAFDAVWRPLLEAKFGSHWQSISMAWFWSRVHVRARSRPRGSLREMLGYIDGSFLELTRTLAVSAERQGARIHLGTPIEGIDRVRDRVRGVRVGGRMRGADAVVATVGLPILRRLLPEHADWIRIPQIQYRGALVLLLQLEEKLSRYYWTNVADAEIPFPVLVEHTNLIGPERYGGARLLYAGSYLDPGHEFFEYSADRLLETYAPAIRRVFPGFEPRQVNDLWLSSDRVAQPVITAGYQRQRPPFATDLGGLYVCNTSQIYPEDRGTNYNVRLAQECARQVAGALQRSGGRRAG